uniref:Uncharacterized protein n=1 Tax=Arundo donax TaxID=35708 RepID=A0A0A9BSY7_ARUDO
MTSIYKSCISWYARCLFSKSNHVSQGYSKLNKNNSCRNKQGIITNIFIYSSILKSSWLIVSATCHDHQLHENDKPKLAEHTVGSVHKLVFLLDSTTDSDTSTPHILISRRKPLSY